MGKRGWHTSMSHVWNSVTEQQQQQQQQQQKRRGGNETRSIIGRVELPPKNFISRLEKIVTTMKVFFRKMKSNEILKRLSL